MSAPDNIDRQSFQSLLANAYSVQQSGISLQSLASIIEIQRTISNVEIDAGSAMNLIADRAQAVAGASGIGIALLEGNQLVHRAGNGSASQSVGSHLAAVLGTSSHDHPRKEILRVEDAQMDTRIEADICRQFDARALLMVPIYREGKMVGVIEVLFNQPHQFSEPEVRTYQLMSALAAEASMLPAEAPEEVSPSTVPHALWRMREIQQLGLRTEPVQRNVEQSQDSAFVRALASIRRNSRHLSRPRLELARAQVLANLQHQMEYIRSLVSRIPARSEFINRLSNRDVQRVFAWRRGWSRKVHWDALAVSLVIVLAIAAAMTRHQSRVSSASDSPARPDTTAMSAQTPPLSTDQSGSSLEPKPQTATSMHAGSPNSAFKRVRVGKNEVDYVADDVTIREFRSAPAPADTRALARQVKIGEDVTVRYFDSKPLSGGEKSVLPKDAALKD